MTRAVVWDTDKTGHYPLEYYFDISQNLCIRAEYNFMEDPAKSRLFSNRLYGNKNELAKYTLYDGKGNTIGELKTHQNLLSICLDQLTSDPNKKYIVFDECALYAGTATVLHKKNVVTATVTHSVFLNDPYNLKSDPQPFYTYMCNNREKFDAIVFLTKEETQDFADKYKQSENLYTIAHPYPFAVKRCDFEERDHKKAVIVSRLDPIKRLQDAIEIFNEVLKKVPDATLDIYGTGTQWNDLQKKIDELGITDNVKLKGHTDNPAEVMSKAACFLFTSALEGLGLTLIESVSNGCPMFAFDIKYGPSYVIRHNITGYLFNKGDIKKYARQLSQYLTDVKTQKRMSENCYDEAPKYGVEVFLDKWWDLTDALYKKMT